MIPEQRKIERVEIKGQVYYYLISERERNLKSYNIRGLANLIGSDREFCLDHTLKVAQDLRDYWELREEIKNKWRKHGTKRSS